MVKVIHEGLAPPDDPVYQQGYSINLLPQASICVAEQVGHANDDDKEKLKALILAFLPKPPSESR